METVDLVGVTADGSHHKLGQVAMPPAMKAREIAASYFGHALSDGNGDTDADYCLAALQDFEAWLREQGWTPPSIEAGIKLDSPAEVLTSGRIEAPSCDGEQRKRLLLAAIGCPHAISDRNIILRRDGSKPGNALAQLGDRLDRALQEAQRGN